MTETWVVNCWVKLYDEEFISQSYSFDSKKEAEECQTIEEKYATWDFVSLEEKLDAR
jgi:hypothetical protein